MQLIKIDTPQDISPQTLRHIADYMEATWLLAGHTPDHWQILPTSVSKLLQEIDPLYSIETDVDTARDHMTWLNYPRQTAQHLFDNVPL